MAAGRKAQERVLDNERVSVRLSPRTRDMIEQIKDQQGLRTDADVIRHALAAYHRISQAMYEQDRVVLYDKDNQLKTELNFITTS